MLNYDIQLPQKMVKKANCAYKPVGYELLSCHFQAKWDTYTIQYSSTSGGSWTFHKGPNNTGTGDQVGDWREGVAADGKWKLQYYKATGWVTVEETDIPA